MIRFLLYVISFHFFLLNLTSQELVRRWEPKIQGSFSGTELYDHVSVSPNHNLIGIVHSERTIDEKSNILWLSKDKGETWYNAKDDYSWEFSGMLPAGVHERRYHSVHCPSDKLILLVGSDNFSSDENQPTHFIHRSEDGGKTWFRYDLTQKPNYTIRVRISMLNDKFGIMTKYFRQDSIYKQRLFKTYDGGKTWEETNLNNVYFGFYVHHLQCFSETEYIVAHTSGLHITTNGGKTWETRVFPADARDFSFLNSKIGFAGGGTKTGLGHQEKEMIYKTLDGGETWITLLDTITEGSGVFSLDFYDEQNGIYGGRERLVRTKDGGKTWELEYLTDDERLSHIPEIRYYEKEKAIALAPRNALVYTGSMMHRPPTINWFSNSKIMLQYSIYWTKINEAKYYRLQIANAAIDPIPWDGHPASFEDNIYLDTLIQGDTIVDVTKYLSYITRNFFRVKAYAEDDSTWWSYEEFFDTPSNPEGNRLGQAKLIAPEHSSRVDTDEITFKWNRVSNAVRYNFQFDRIMYVTDFDYTIRDTQITVRMPKFSQKKSYKWEIIAYAPHMIPSVAKAYFWWKVGPVGVDYEEHKESAIVYPNPASEYITVNSDVVQKEMNIYNIYGQVVIKSKSTNKIEVSFLPKGIYFIKQGTRIYSFIKN